MWKPIIGETYLHGYKKFSITLYTVLNFIVDWFHILRFLLSHLEVEVVTCHQLSIMRFKHWLQWDKPLTWKYHIQQFLEIPEIWEYIYYLKYLEYHHIFMVFQIIIFLLNFYMVIPCLGRLLSADPISSLKVHLTVWQKLTFLVLFLFFLAQDKLKSLAAWAQEGLEELSHAEGQEGWQWRDTPSSKVRSSGCALLEQPWRDTPRPR